MVRYFGYQMRDYEYKVKYEDALARIATLENEMKKMIYPPVSNEELDELLDLLGED
jgi:hypothetical protein